jgi:hypothetical protein
MLMLMMMPVLVLILILLLKQLIKTLGIMLVMHDSLNSLGLGVILFLRERGRFSNRSDQPNRVPIFKDGDLRTKLNRLRLAFLYVIYKYLIKLDLL